MSSELSAATSHHHDMTEKLLKATLNPNTHTHSLTLETTKLIEAKFHVEPPIDGGNEGLFKWSRSHDQAGRHVHIW